MYRAPMGDLVAIYREGDGLFSTNGRAIYPGSWVSWLATTCQPRWP
jgi:hypothetical protein